MLHVERFCIKCTLYVVLYLLSCSASNNLIIASEASSVTNCANLRFLVYIFIASEASSVTNCANLRFLVYIFIYIYMSPYVLFGPARAPRNAQRANVGPAG